MSFTVIIPARYAATRLPGKLLLDLMGKPLLQHTFEQAQKSDALAVFIATDDARIETAAKKFGAKVIMTSDSHVSGTDRLQEAASLIGLSTSDVVVNVQGDEPLIPPEVINQVASNIVSKKEFGIATLCELIVDEFEIDDPNSVKVVFDNIGNALYFSRSTLPHNGSVSAGNSYRHVGLYAYRVEVLNQFIRWPVAQLELSEKLEQLRALHNGVKIHVEVSSQQIPAGVDTQRDLEGVRQFLIRAD
jgi:3-deoxy-manno-octulosonate cytidylyltransferase (CMP-KDO synthetase)|tara:strand:+ start:2572 stop:3309 length:738 start_codon:yes stop_codon:yes gene_type:complete